MNQNKEKSIWVLGIGPGKEDLIFPAVFQKMNEVDVILGSKRQLEILPSYLKDKGNTPPWKIEDLKVFLNQLLKDGKQIGILASGDPLLFGIGVTLKKHFPNEVAIVPGISSLGYFFSLLGISMNDVYLSSCHGREIDFKKLLHFSKIGLLTDKHLGPFQIAQNILGLGGEYQMFIGENLSYPEEKIWVGALEEVSDREYDMNVVILLREDHDER